MSKQTPQISKSDAHKQAPINKKIFIVLAVISCLVLASLLLYGLKKGLKKPVNDKKEAGICSGAVLTEASRLLAPESTDKLKVISDNIQLNARYDTDPNCIYVVLNSHINSNEPKKASEDLDKLNKIYKPAVGFSLNLGSKPKTISELKADIVFRETVSKEQNTNTLLLPEHP